MKPLGLGLSLSHRSGGSEPPVSPWAEATGGTVTENGGYRYHTFTTSGDLVVTKAGQVELLLVGGGGGGSKGGNVHGGGGGAGGLITNEGHPEILQATIGSIAIAIGAGGNGSDSVTLNGGAGTNSSFGEYIAYGGGGGVQYESGVNDSVGQGGSGGGASARASAAGGIGGKSIQSTIISDVECGFGNAGGTRANTSLTKGCGGGGAGGVGENNAGTNANAGKGGAHKTVFGVDYAAGGSSPQAVDTYAIGGLSENINGLANRGCGGAGGGKVSGVVIKGGNGSAGICVVRYAI